METHTSPVTFPATTFFFFFVVLPTGFLACFLVFVGVLAVGLRFVVAFTVFLVALDLVVALLVDFLITFFVELEAAFFFGRADVFLTVFVPVFFATLFCRNLKNGKGDTMSMLICAGKPPLNFCSHIVSAMHLNETKNKTTTIESQIPWQSTT